MIRLTTALCILFVAMPFSVAHSSEAKRAPNVILILVDDQGYYDLGCYGATEVQTPNVDRMAREGVRLTDYYAAAPICSPSRAGLLTGCYPRRVGNHIWVHRADSDTGIHPDELTLAELFKASGYLTACIGKWHLGFHDDFLPRNQGFDHYFGLLHNLDPLEVVYFDDVGGVPLLRNGDVVKRPADPSELTKLYTDESIELIRDASDQPFFIYLPHTMLHHPLGASEAFRGSSKWGEYGDAIQELDYNVGRIFDALEETGIQDDTIVVYVSDNGRGPGRSPSQEIRGRKLSTYEGGLRVPAIIWGPGQGIQSGHASSAIVRAMDWYPTLATMAGIRVPDGVVIDGRDISRLLQGKTKSVPAPNVIPTLNDQVPLRRHWDPPGEWRSVVKRNEYNDAFFYYGSQGALAAVRWRNWKLVLNPTLQLYDLASDLGETQPIRNGEVTRKLRGMSILFQEEMQRDARPAGRAQPPREDGRTEVSRGDQERLHAQLDVTYARYGERSLEMDLFRPKSQWGNLPAIVCIHGGGWRKGNKVHLRNLAQTLALQGYVTASISYRLSGEAPFPAQIHDCKAAVRFLRANAERYGIDDHQIGVIGHSAGGHLAALLATSGDVPALEGSSGNPDFSSRVQAAIPMGGQTDLLSTRTKMISSDPNRGEIWRAFLGGSQTDAPSTYRLASPLVHLDALDPPCWLITGADDDPSTHADPLRTQMKGLGIPSGLTVIQDAPHAFLSRQRWFDEAVTSASLFFAEHLSGERRAADLPTSPTDPSRN
ncbi:MAG: alpha/beta fold hydrolase [Planctomycetota bacterium]